MGGMRGGTTGGSLLANCLLMDTMLLLRETRQRRRLAELEPKRSQAKLRMTLQQLHDTRQFLLLLLLLLQELPSCIFLLL